MKKIERKILQESDIDRIVSLVKNETNNNLDEGLKDVWSGLKGTYRGYGYKYTKNLSALQDIIGDLSYSEKFLNQIRKKCDRIIDDVANAKMSENKMNHIVDVTNDIINAIDRYSHDMKVISDDVRSIVE
jgi:hypothetical protein